MLPKSVCREQESVNRCETKDQYPTGEEKEEEETGFNGRTRHQSLAKEERQCLPLSASQTGASGRPETCCF